MKKYWGYLAIAVFVIVLGVFVLMPAAVSEVSTPQATDADGTAKGAPMVEVILPDQLSANAEIGKMAFEASCAQCHGINAAGQEGVAPPLVHKIYEPGHHGDESFWLATQRGVRSHHWSFGDMPQIGGLTQGDVKMIVVYIRELQRANGID